MIKVRPLKEKSLGEEQDSNPSVQRIESADKVINDNPDQTEIGETDYTTSPGPQSTQIQQIVRNQEEDPELLTTGEEGTVDENRLIDAEIELPVAETQGGNTDTDKVKVSPKVKFMKKGGLHQRQDRSFMSPLQIKIWKLFGVWEEQLTKITW